MTKRMLIDAANKEEVRVCLLENGKVEDFDFESASRKPLRGNIYLARVTRVEPSLQAAFIEYGGNRHGFLAFSEIHPDYYQIPVSDREAIQAAEAEEADLAAQLNLNTAADEDDPQGDLADDADAEDSAAASDRGGAANGTVDAGEDDATAGEGPDGEPSAEAAAEDRAPVNDAAADGDQPADYAPTDEDGAVAAADAAGDAADDAASEIEASGDETSDNGANGDADAAPGDDDEPKSDGPAGAALAAKGPTARLNGPLVEDDADADEAQDGEAQDGDAQREETSADSETATDHDDDAFDNDEQPEDIAANAENDLDTDDNEDVDDLDASTAEDAADDEDEDGDEERVDDEPDLDAATRAELLERYKDARRRRQRLIRNYKIQEVVKRRQIMLVQVVKEERGNKGAALTTYMSLAGRYCVLMPNTPRGGGISRKIPSASDRKRLRGVVGSLDVPQGMGLIIRTAGAKRTKAEIKRDYDYLSRLWENIRSLTLKSIAPCLIYEEASLIKRAIRDLYDKDIGSVLVEGEGGYREAKDFMKMLMPSHAKNVQPYKDPTPLFLRHDVEQQLDAMYQPVVRLKSGGYLVINQTEALIAVDVNSGKATRERNIEQTALKTNLEAAREVARQCRLRDLAGLIVLDFIDMEEHRNNRAVEKRLKEALKSDRARVQVGRISGFGLLEMSRQRRRSGIVDGTTVACPTCGGAGAVRSPEMAGLRILRALEAEALRGRAGGLRARTALEVALYILNHKREWLNRIETAYGVHIELAADASKAGDQHEIEAFGGRRDAAGPVAAVRADLSAPEDDDIVEDRDEDVDQAAQDGDAEARDGDDEPGRGRKRRRRRRRKRGDGDEAGADAEARADEREADDRETSESDDGASADGEEDAARADDSDDDDADRPKRRRRRGRRGGRRNNRERDGDETAADEDQAAADGDKQQGAQDAPAEAFDMAGAPQPTVDLYSFEDAADDAADNAADNIEQRPAAAGLSNGAPREDAAADHDTDAEPAIAAPVDTAALEDESTATESEDIHVPEPMEPPKRAPIEDTPPRKDRPARKGWWQRALGG